MAKIKSKPVGVKTDIFTVICWVTLSASVIAFLMGDTQEAIYTALATLVLSVIPKK